MSTLTTIHIFFHLNNQPKYAAAGKRLAMFSKYGNLG